VVRPVLLRIADSGGTENMLLRYPPLDEELTLYPRFVDLANQILLFESTE
jgi:hypothetical protein